jgi:hypothetical protein
MQKGWLSFKQAPSKKMAPSMLNFSQLHHQTHSWPEKKLQDAGINTKLAIISERPVKFACADLISSGKGKHQLAL